VNPRETTFASEPLSGELLERLAGLALAGVGREYPNHLSLLLTSDADARPPRELTPAFFGCFDWHSAVHGHWTLARLARIRPDAAFAARARAALGASLAGERIAGEVAFLSAPGREGFERPYGLAWLLQLAAELREWRDERPSDREPAAWSEAIAPLERLAARRIGEWLPKLVAPIRTGEHSQTAFALGLVLDWARVADDPALARLARKRSLDFHAGDRDAPIAYEPSGHDFLSPVLGQADLMRRVLDAGEFASWLGGFLPSLGTAAAARWLEPVRSPDPADGKLSHLDGLNLSRAWMLEGVLSALPGGDERAPALRAAAAALGASGLAAVTGEHYAGAHWLGSFAAYLVTRRGIQGGGGRFARGGTGC
jgi:hypothetical protein